MSEVCNSESRARTVKVTGIAFLRSEKCELSVGKGILFGAIRIRAPANIGTSSGTPGDVKQPTCDQSLTRGQS